MFNSLFIYSDNLNSCKYRNYEYARLSTLTFEEAFEYTKLLTDKPSFIDCDDYSAFWKTSENIFIDVYLKKHNNIMTKVPL